MDHPANRTLSRANSAAAVLLMAAHLPGRSRPFHTGCHGWHVLLSVPHEDALACHLPRQVGEGIRAGVITQPAGDARNVLKIEPPPCLSDEAASFFVARLDCALYESGWQE